MPAPLKQSQHHLSVSKGEGIATWKRALIASGGPGNIRHGNRRQRALRRRWRMQRGEGHPRVIVGLSAIHCFSFFVCAFRHVRQQRRWRRLMWLRWLTRISGSCCVCSGSIMVIAVFVFFSSSLSADRPTCVGAPSLLNSPSSASSHVPVMSSVSMPSSAHSWTYFGLSSMSTSHPSSTQISALERCGPVSAYAFPKLMLRNVPGGKWRAIHARVGSSMTSCLDVTMKRSCCSRRRLMELTAPGIG